MTEETPRDALLDRVNMGELTPAQAEAEAKRLGMASLQPPDPNPELFDPTREAQWTLPMAVAWIAYREISAVRNRWEAYRGEFWIWHERRFPDGRPGSMRSGWLLGRRGKTTMESVVRATDAEATAERDPRFSMKPAEAIKALWDALQSDCFRTTGIDQKSWARVEILPTTWLDLKYFEENGEDEVRPEAPHLGGYARYRDVLLPSRVIRGLWRAPFAIEPLRLPPIMPPVGDGYMPLYCAAQWIATEGGTVDFDPESIAVWRKAFDLLLSALASRKVAVVGTRDGEREHVPEVQFADCRVDYPFSDASMDLILSNDLYLQSTPYYDEEHWRDGYDDALMDRQHHRWSRLIVARADIRREWPFGVDADRTGAPGRPTSMHLILDEMERRAASGQLEAKVRDQAKVLADWFASTHPLQSRPTPKTVENQIRTRFRQLSLK
jgi:hypothetical protein